MEEEKEENAWHDGRGALPANTAALAMEALVRHKGGALAALGRRLGSARAAHIHRSYVVLVPLEHTTDHKLDRSDDDNGTRAGMWTLTPIPTRAPKHAAGYNWLRWRPSGSGRRATRAVGASGLVRGLHLRPLRAPARALFPRRNRGAHNQHNGQRRRRRRVVTSYPARLPSRTCHQRCFTYLVFLYSRILVGAPATNICNICVS